MKTKYYINGISFYGVDWTCSSNPESKPLFGRILVEAMRQISHLRYKILHLNFPEASSTIIWSVIPTWNRYEEDKSITNIGNLPDLEAITNSPTYDQYLLDLRNATLQLLGYSNNPLFSKGFIRIGTENDKYPTRYSFRLIYNDIFNADRSTWCRNEITCKKLLTIDIEEILKFIDILNFATPITNQNILEIDDQEDITMDTHIHRTWAHGLNSNIFASAHSGSYTYPGENFSLTGANFSDSSSRRCIDFCCTGWGVDSLACPLCRSIYVTSYADYSIHYITPVLLWDSTLGWSIDALSKIFHVKSSLILDNAREDGGETYHNLKTNLYSSVTANYKIYTKNHTWEGDWNTLHYQTKRHEEAVSDLHYNFINGDTFSLQSIAMSKMWDRGYYDPQQNDYVHDVKRIYVTSITFHAFASSYAKGCLNKSYWTKWGGTHGMSEQQCTTICAQSFTSFYLPNNFPT